MEDKAAIFIDSGYLSAIFKHQTHIKFDILKLIKKLSSGHSLFRSYYYHCVPYVSQKPTVEEKDKQSNYNKYLSFLKTIPRLTLRQGKLEKRNSEYKQKRVDIMMAVDLVGLSSKNVINTAILVTGDSDFVPAINSAKDQGVIVKIYYHKNCVHNELLDSCDERIEMNNNFFKNIEKST